MSIAPFARASALLGIVLVVAAGCAAEPGPGSSATGTPSTPAASPSPTATAAPDESLTFPASCDDLYSAGMRAVLDADIPPLNDSGTTMLSTENIAALEILESAEQTIRCSWGPPSERGMATNVTVITPEQHDELLAAFEQGGFSAEDLDGGTLHSIRQEVLTPSDDVVTLGETHYLRGDGWVATRWIAVDIEGYTQDVVASLWG